MPPTPELPHKPDAQASRAPPESFRLSASAAASRTSADTITRGLADTPTRDNATAGNASAANSSPVHEDGLVSSEDELWTKASDWVQKQVLVTFRHRAILSRLAPVMDGVARVDVTESMLSIELPNEQFERQAARDRLCARRLRTATSSGASASPLRSGELHAVAPHAVARAASKTSVELMTDAVRVRIRILDGMPVRPLPRRAQLRRKNAVIEHSLGSGMSRTADSAECAGAVLGEQDVVAGAKVSTALQRTQARNCGC